MASVRESDSDATLSSDAIQTLPRNNITEEYVTQFLGFTPTSFCDGVYNAVHDYIHDAVHAVNQSLLQMQIPHVREEDIELGGQTIVHYFLKKTQQAFDKFENYVRQNIFVIPDAVLLHEDQEHAWNSYSLEDEKRLDQETLQIQEKIKNVKYMQARLQKTDEELDFLIAECEKLNKYLNDSGITSKCEQLAEVVKYNVPMVNSVLDDIQRNQ